MISHCPGADPESSAGGSELWRGRERKPIWGSGVGSRGKVRGSGLRPPEADAFL